MLIPAVITDHIAINKEDLVSPHLDGDNLFLTILNTAFANREGSAFTINRTLTGTGLEKARLNFAISTEVVLNKRLTGRGLNNNHQLLSTAKIGNEG